MAQLYSGKGGREQGAAAHVHLKRHARKQHESASTQNRYIQNAIINDLWYFKLKLHRHILGTPETCIAYCKKGHNMPHLNSLFLIFNML